MDIPKEIYKFIKIPIKIVMTFFTKTGKISHNSYGSTKEHK
jgi:hypothetical protein